jgi:hypothetical protein
MRNLRLMGLPERSRRASVLKLSAKRCPAVIEGQPSVKAVRDLDCREGQHVQRSQTEQAAPRKVTCEIRKHLTIEHRTDRPVRVGQNHKLSARPGFPHILGVMQSAMELTQQEQPAFDTVAFFGQRFEAHLDSIQSQKVKIKRITNSIQF